jgi:hypothetical protein
LKKKRKGERKKEKSASSPPAAPFPFLSPRPSTHPRPSSPTLGSARTPPLSLFRSLTAETRLSALLPQPERSLSLSLWSLGPARQGPNTSLLPSSSLRTSRPKSPSSPSTGPAHRDPRPGLYLAPADPLHLISYPAAAPNPSAAAPFFSAVPSLCAAMHPSLRCTPAQAKTRSSSASLPGCFPRLPLSTPSPAAPESSLRAAAGELLHHGNFLTARGILAVLTPCTPPQAPPEAIQGAQHPGVLLRRPSPRASTSSAARPPSTAATLQLQPTQVRGEPQHASLFLLRGLG